MFLVTLFASCRRICARGQALQEAAGSATITKEGLKLKQISLTDFKVRKNQSRRRKGKINQSRTFSAR